jgi:hypothetical protein
MYGMNNVKFINSKFSQVSKGRALNPVRFAHEAGVRQTKYETLAYSHY